MQIHELNNFTGTLGSGAYLAVDDGNDTGKLSTQQLLSATEARIDNIIAGPAPSAQEVTDARLGADGVVYPSLGDAIRDQVSDLKSEISGYELQEKAVTSGNELGWYGLSGGVITENAHATWTRMHITAPFPYNSIRFTISQQIKCVFVVKNGVIDAYEQVGDYDVNISEASDVYMNFFTTAFVSNYKLYYSYKPYKSGYIKFEVMVNQKIANTNDTANELLDNENNMAKVTCHMKLPTTYRPYGKKSKLLMICHGAGRGVTIENPSDHETWEDNTNYNNLLDTFVNAGYVVFDCNGMKDDYWGCNFWGAHRGVEAWKKAYDYIVRNYNVDENFSIYGFSMGGLTAMNLVINKFPNIKCVALGSPVLNLEKCWEDGQQTLMRNAYGMGDDYEPDKARGCDPMQTLVTINGNEYCLANMPPIKIWYGSTEQGIAVNKAYAEEMVNAIVKSGNFAIYREVLGENHRICFGASAICNQEYLYWIERFNAREYTWLPT